MVASVPTSGVICNLNGHFYQSYGRRFKVIPRLRTLLEYRGVRRLQNPFEKLLISSTTWSSQFRMHRLSFIDLLLFLGERVDETFVSEEG